MTLFGFFILKD